MHKSYNIFSKFLLILILMMGWGNSAWANAVFVTPTYVSSYDAGSGNEGPDKLVDGRTNTKWGRSYTNGTSHPYVVVRVNGGMVLHAYKLFNGNDTNGQPGRRWKKWTIEGSNDQTNWSLIHTIYDGRMNTINYGENLFTIKNNNTRYEYYRITVLNNEGATMIQMSELQFSESPLTEFPTLRNNVAVSFVGGEGVVKYYDPESETPIDITAGTTDFGNILYDARFLSVSGSFHSSFQSVDFNNDNQTLTLSYAANKWYKMRVANINAYVSTDYADVNGMRLTSGQTEPTNYAGIWRSVDVAGTALNSDGKNVSLYNAKYYESKILAMTRPADDGQARGAMYAPSAVPSGAATVFEQRTRTGQANSYYFRITGQGVNTNTYINQRNPYFSNWTNGGYGGAGSQFIYEEVPNLGTAVTIVIKDANGQILPDAKIVYTSQRVDIATVTDQLGHNQVYNFGDVPYLRSLFTTVSALDMIISATFDEAQQKLTFVLGKDTNLIQFSSAPVNGAWADDTHWFTFRNNRSNQEGHNRKYVTTSAAAIRDNDFALLPNLATMPNDLGSYWCFVGNNSTGFYIQNAAYGPDFVLGITGGDPATVKMLPKDQTAGYTTVFTAVDNTVTDGATHAYAFRLGTYGNSHIHVTMGRFLVYNNSAISGGDTGSAFKLTNVPQSTIDALTAYDVYKVQWKGAVDELDIDYADPSKIFGKRGNANHGSYMIIEQGSSVEKEQFTVSNSAYALGSTEVTPAAGHFYRNLVLSLRDKAATVPWTIIISQDDADHTKYVVTHQGNTYVDGEIFYWRPNVTPAATDFTINAPVNKFVWGPVFNTQAKTVTYEIRDLATTLTTGWYQLQIPESDIATLRDKINPKAGNINTKANTLYLAPAIYVNEANKIMKVTGVPQYAGKASTFVYIEKNLNGIYTLTSPVTGQSITGSFLFSNGVLTMPGGWSYEGTPQPLEGPFMMPLSSSSSTPSFKISAADISDYTIYKVRILDGSAAATDVRLNISNSNVLGSTTVSNGGYLFMQKNSSAPLASQANVMAGNVKVTDVTTDVDTDGVSRITFHVATKQTMWKAIITGEAADYAADRIIYAGQNYKNGELMALTEGYEPTALDFKTNIENRFVWGPIIDRNAKTVKFEIKHPVDVAASSGNPLRESGWYQFQLVPYDKGNAFINDINSHCTSSKSRAGSYIYMFNADTEYQQNASNFYPVKFAAVPGNGDPATSFLYVKDNGNTPQFQAINGHYIKENGCMSTTPANMLKMEANTLQNIYGIYRWYRYDTGSDEAPYMGASGNNLNFYVRAVKVNPSDNYEVYQVNLNGTGQDKVRYIGTDNHGVNVLYNNGYLLLTKGAAAPTKEDFYFDGVTSIERIDISAQRVITFTLSSRASGYSNTIIHRQHGVYDHIATVDNSLLPKGSHIKRGEGMIEHPMKGKFPSGYTDNDCHIQNTSVFHVTQYTKPGTRTECILPFTRGKSTEQAHVSQYQRWYNYQTERPLSNDILTLEDGNSTLGNFYEFTNGHSNYNASGRQFPVLGKADIKLPSGYEELYVGVDASEFQDTKTIKNNLVEPSLNMRVVYHIISAHKMAAALVTNGITWWEEKEYYVPNIKRGSDTYKNNADLIPLDMPFCNYWIYKVEGNTSDNNLMPIVAENGDYNTLKRNLEIKVEGSAADYIDVGVFDGNPGNIGSAPYINGNHFLYYKVKGAGVTRTIPAGSQAVIKVYAKDGSNASSPKYQLFKFTLNFQAGSEPLAITSVVGNPASTRSVDYFIKNGFKESASLTFMNKDVSFAKIPGHRNDGNEGVTYAFPIDFSRTSYGYSPSNTFGNYRITTRGYGNQFRPVSLYEHNIKNRANTTMKSADDYFFFIDAAESPGQVASITLDGTLCVGSRLYCYGWFGSSNNYDGAGNPSGASVLLQVVGRRIDGTEEVIASYLPGTITDVSYDDEGDMMRSLSYASFPSQQQAGWMNLNAPQVGVWNSVGFTFVVKDVGFESYDLRIINNCFSTSGGDYVLDDFRVFVNAPKGNVDFTTPLCSDALRHVKVYTDFDMLIESSGVNQTIPGISIPASFCFLRKDIYDDATVDYYDVDSLGNRTQKKDVDYDDPAVQLVFNTAFGDALIGERTIRKDVKGHGFHNFNVPTDYNSLETYAYKDSPDDYIYKEEKNNGERRVVFKEQLYQSSGAAHNWEPGKEYYLLFAPYHVTDEHLQKHDVGTQIFHISDMCCVLTTFSIMPPIEVKGDATITSTDQVRACDNQVVTLKVDMPALKLNDDETDVTDAVITGLNYDWWVGTSKADATYAGFMATTFGTYEDIEDARRYNHKSVDDYPDPASVDRNVYLESALANIRFYFPEVRMLDEVTLVPYDNDKGYGVVEEHIACVAKYLEPLADGRKPLSLFGQTFNLKVSHAEADSNNKQHFVAIPIVPEQEYGVDKKLIYCPAPQELIIEVGETAPNMQNGFGGRTYPSHIDNVPVRLGLQQANAVRKNIDADPVYTLNIPLRKIKVTGSESTQLVSKDGGAIYLAATDDPSYSFDEAAGEFSLRQVAQVVDIHALKESPDDAYMKIAFLRDFAIHEGCTYTLKLPYMEDEECDCEGTLLFDIKVVPEYVIWSPNTPFSDWTNDANWARADRDELNADNTPMGDIISGATSLTTAASYPDNETNKTAKAFVPMYFTNVLVGESTIAPDLYPGLTPATSTFFLRGLKPTATRDIQYDLEVTPVDATHRTNYTYACNYTCEPFDTYIANGLTFLPGGTMLHAEQLRYHKAWVEYELDVNRWYLLSSPLQSTFAGEWYAPTGTNTQNAAKQLTPHFYDILYSEADCDRFRPAIYQRSWDSDQNYTHSWMKDGSDCNAYITGDWSFVYNDVLQRYGSGGFSVKVSDMYMQHQPADEKALIRLPKADAEYTYYDINGSTGQKNDDVLPTVSGRGRLWTDQFNLGTGGKPFEQYITNVSEDNNYFLVGNPFMAGLDMEEFFRTNTQFEKTYWLLSEDGQTTSVRSAYENSGDTSVPEDERWTVTDSEGKFAANAAVVAPMQGFFVRTTAPTNSTTIYYSISMQTNVVPTLKRLTNIEVNGNENENANANENGNENENENENNGPTGVYSIDGKKVGTDSSDRGPVPGVYIVNGVKVVFL